MHATAAPAAAASLASMHAAQAPRARAVYMRAPSKTPGHCHCRRAAVALCLTVPHMWPRPAAALPRRASFPPGPARNRPRTQQAPPCVLPCIPLWTLCGLRARSCMVVSPGLPGQTPQRSRTCSHAGACTHMPRQRRANVRTSRHMPQECMGAPRCARGLSWLVVC